MKIIKYLFFILAVTACKKGEVPGNDSQYVGEWTNKTLEDQYVLTIKEDGTAKYGEYHLGSYKEISGYIYFDGYDFKIGTYRINKKFKANQPPKRVTTSVNPYKYYYIATFNGIDYKKE
ncbi:MAG: hypothetical protein ACXVNM_02800 [Bacteroidia bacterium]